MAWIEARDQVHTIVKETPPSLLIRGAPAKFRLVDLSELSETRSFALHLGPEMFGVGPLMPSPQALCTQWGAVLIVAYRPHKEAVDLDALMAADYLALRLRLVSDVYWNRPPSTIDTINVGNSARIMGASVDRLDDGNARLKIPLQITTTGAA